MTSVYVHDGIEVVLTGRVAYRKTRGARKVDPERRPKLVEIEPKNKGNLSADLKKWVSEEELYEIE